MEAVKIIEWFAELHGKKSVKFLKIDMEAGKETIDLTMRVVIEKPKAIKRNAKKRTLAK